MRRLLWLSGILALPLAGRSGNAVERPPQVIGEVISNVCLDCHDTSERKGGLDLEALPFDLRNPALRRRWIELFDRVKRREMPPRAAQWDDNGREAFLNYLEKQLHQADERDVRATGRNRLRRLTRTEYENQLRDFLELPHLDIRDLLPAERTTEGYRKSAATLDLSRVQLESFLDAAESALRTALHSGRPSPSPLRYRAIGTDLYPKLTVHAGRESMHFSKQGRMVPVSSSDLKDIQRTGQQDDTLEMALFRSATWPYYGYPRRLLANESGAYRVRFSARAVRQLPGFRLVPAQRPVPLTFRARQPSAADVSGDVRSTGGVMDVLPTPSVFETTVHLKKGETFEYSLLGLPVPHPITSHGGPLYYNFPPMPPLGHRGIAFRWLEVEGPVGAPSWPSPTHRILFQDLPLSQGDPKHPIALATTDPVRDGSRLMRAFIENAACAPVPEATCTPFIDLVHRELDRGQRLLDALLTGYQAFLASRHFIYLPPAGPQTESPSHSVAAQLSHFLWSSRPDRPLRHLADEGQLLRPSVLKGETNRLIMDPRFDRFIADFTDEWLELGELKRDTPDLRLYPEYRKDDYLVESMAWETRTFLTDLIRENRPIGQLIDTTELWVNDRLAQHYGLPPVSGSGIRRVPRPPRSPYGGLLTQAAVLKITSNGTTTSPVLRGAWVMEKLLSDPPPPPPARVPAVTPDLRGTTTLREQLLAHTKDETCATCHARFDPVGFALESFDIMGAWRDRYRSLETGDPITGVDRAGHRFEYRIGPPVDSRGTLLTGEPFEDIFELKKVLSARPRVLARSFLHHLIHYATGVPVRFSDRRVIRSILDQCRETGYGARDLLTGFIQSRLFLDLPPEPNPEP